MSIRTRFLAAVLICTLATAALLVTIGVIESRAFSARAAKDVEKMTDWYMDRSIFSTHDLVQSQAELLSAVVGQNDRSFASDLRLNGGIRFSGPPQRWSATNQLSKETTSVSLPAPKVGESVLSRVDDPNASLAILDPLAKRTDSTYTLFQRMNKQGDMLRVATTVVGKNGKRAVGTYIPATNPDGKPNPVLAAVLAGNPYEGTAFVVDKWYVTSYSPIRDAGGNVIGMTFAGKPQHSVPTLRKVITETKVGENGETYVLGGTGDKRGQFMIPPDGAKEFEDGLARKDDAGNAYLQTVVDAAVKLSPGEHGALEYKVTEGGKTTHHLVHYMYYAPWDWVVVVDADEASFQHFLTSLEQGRSTMVFHLVLAGAILAVVGAIGAVIFANRTTRPIVQMTEAARELAMGNIDQKLDYVSRDEIGQMADAFREMIEYQREVADVAIAVSDGDLTKDVKPKSEKDAMGNAFVTMIKSIRLLIGALASNIDEVAKTSDLLTESSKTATVALEEMGEAVRQVTEASDQAAHASSEVARGSEQLAVTAGGASNAMENLTGSIDSVREANAMQTRTAAEASTASQKVTGAVQETIASMERIQREVEASSTSVEELGAKGEKIGQIVQTIEDIAGQTNLLALNAAIEAARAGEQGRGFAVVADEVRKLAERSGDATKEIAELIADVQSNVQKAVEAMKVTAEEVSGGARSSTSARQALLQIDAAIEAVKVAVDQAAESSESMLSEVQKVSDAITSVAAISEESAASAEEMSAAVHEVSGHMDRTNSNVQVQVGINGEVLRAAQSLSTLTKEVTELVHKFDSFMWDRRTNEDPAKMKDERRVDTIHQAAYRLHTGKESETKNAA